MLVLIAAVAEGHLGQGEAGMAAQERAPTASSPVSMWLIPPSNTPAPLSAALEGFVFSASLLNTMLLFDHGFALNSPFFVTHCSKTQLILGPFNPLIKVPAQNTHLPGTSQH